MALKHMEAIRAAAVDFLAAAFETLGKESVIPPSRYRPYLDVGRDYEGPGIMALPEFKRLEQLLTEA